MSDRISSADVCPGPTYGYARVEGTTDGAGRFAVQMVYANADTILFAHPPRDAAGNFIVPCGVGGEVRHDVFARDSALVPFAPTRAAMTTVQVSLVESAMEQL